MIAFSILLSVVLVDKSFVVPFVSIIQCNVYNVKEKMPFVEKKCRIHPLLIILIRRGLLRLKVKKARGQEDNSPSPFPP